MSDPKISRLTSHWPGKSRPAEHPALWHMLDVGAVASRLLADAPLADAQVNAACACLIALHDLGKISASFRAMLREDRPQHKRHWEHSAVLLLKFDALLDTHLGGTDTVREVLIEAVAGHHGGPRCAPSDKGKAQLAHEIGPEAFEDAEAVLKAVLSLFPDASLADLRLAEAQRLSWRLNGLTIQSDWIGSNPDWFPPAPADLTLGTYWQRAQKQAQQAIAKAGVTPASVGSGVGVLPPQIQPHPMQFQAGIEPINPAPSLFLIEDATGAGKTEAALILARRMMQAGLGRGVFFALPTMATANAMLPRLDRAAPALFQTPPSLALSHGRANLSAPFRQLQARDGANPETGAHCSRWLAEDRRRVLLADLGVGTVDQVLFGVLPTRFNGLRLHAMAQKILIVDEAHSYDPYMQAELERVLRMQAHLGGSAILMTATLPGPKKRAFIQAFQMGLGVIKESKRGRPPPPLVLDPAYPALTQVGAVVRSTAVNPAPGTQRKVKVRRCPDVETAVGLITQAAQQGAACVWIRNSVDDAIAAMRLLQAQGVAADLLHARFALCDRLSAEERLQTYFGKRGADRAGRVLVATQVVEQSLDLDFDVMVSDLAPIGSVIQRAGRLWRHMLDRPASDRPVSEPVLHILSPDPAEVETDRWLHQVLDKGAYVYDVTLSWRSAQALFAAGEIAAPQGIRDLIEAVEGDAPLPLPAALEDAQFSQEGAEKAERGMAQAVLIDTLKPFDQERMQKVWDDEAFPTRLGVPQITLALARRGPGGLVPWAAESEEGMDRWALSEVQISKKRYEDLDNPKTLAPDGLYARQATAEIRAIKSEWSAARAEHTLIAEVSEDGRICLGLRYDPKTGLTVLADEEQLGG